MIKILIIEDEFPARKKLKRFIDRACTDYQIVGEIETVDRAIAFLEENQDIDIVFSDIELRDGNVFEVYNKVSVNCPIIFATAYNEFLMSAFETNGIEYLLKPFSYDRFLKAWNKFSNLSGKQNNQDQLVNSLNKLLQSSPAQKSVSYKDQIAIKTSKDIYFLKVDDIVYFQADNGVVYAFDKENRRHIMSQNTLKEIETLLDPQQFFRINRSESINRKYIDKLERYSKNIVSVYINSGSESLKTSQNRTGDFNNWLGI